MAEKPSSDRMTWGLSRISFRKGFCAILMKKKKASKDDWTKSLFGDGCCVHTKSKSEKSKEGREKKRNVTGVSDE